MARFNTALTSNTISGATTVGSPYTGAFTELTGTAPYTVTLASPVLFPGVNQTFYNATSGTVTLSTPAGNFVGTGGTAATTVPVYAGNVVSVTADGTNYIVISEDGSALVATSATISGVLTVQSTGGVAIAPSTTGAIDNVNIGATTRGSGAFNTLTSNNAVTFTANTASTTTGTGTVVITGGLGVSGTINATSVSASLTGTIQTASQTNITSVGTLTALTVSGATNLATSSGNVGIGTASPVTLKSVQTLQVLGNIKLGVDNASGLLSLGDIASTGANVAVWRGSGGAYGTSGNYLNLGGYDGITLTTGNTSIDSQTERMRITTAGNVGIGITNPAYPLVVSNAGGNGFEVSPTSGINGGVLLQAYSRSGSAYVQQSYYALAHSFTVGSGAGTRAVDIDSNGNLLPSTTNTFNLGSATQKWNNYYGTVDNTVNINTNTTVNRPTLVADFTTGTFDHRIFFLRNSIGTYTGPDGYIKTAPINTPRIDWDPITRDCKGLLIEETRTNYRTFSDRMDQASTSPSNLQAIIPNAALSPDGTWSATNIVENTSNARHEFSVAQAVTNGTIYTYSIYAKAAGRNYIALAYAGSPISNFNLTNGTVVGSSGSITPVIQAVGNGWYRCAITFTATSTTTTAIYHCIISTAVSGGVETYTGNGTSGLYIWGGQFETANYMSSYIPTTTVAGGRNSTGTYFDSSGQLRTAAAGANRYGYNYDVATNKWYPIGNIIEPQATNLLTNSNLYADSFSGEAIWTKTNSSTDVIAPDGSSTTTKAVSGTSGNSYLWRYSSATYTVNSTYTTSFWCRTASGTGSFSITAYPYNSINATVTTTWTRFSITYTPTSGTAPYIGVVGPSLSTTFYFWGWQVELGVFPTSYIPTTGATVTRAADSASSTANTRLVDNARYTNNNLTSWYNQSASTLYVEHDVTGLSNNAAVAHDVFCFSKVVSGLNYGTETGAVSLIYNNSTSPGLNLSVSGVGGAAMLSSTPLNTRNRTAMAWSSGTNMLYGATNGSSASSGVTIPTYQYILTLGNSPDVAGRVLNGHIYKLIYYPTQLSTSELQELAG